MLGAFFLRILRLFAANSDFIRAYAYRAVAGAKAGVSASSAVEIDHGMPTPLRGLLYRPKHQLANSRDAARQAGGDSLCATPA